MEYDLDTRGVFHEKYMLQSGFKVGDLVVPAFMTEIAIVTMVDPVGRIQGWRTLNWTWRRRGIRSGS